MSAQPIEDDVQDSVDHGPGQPETAQVPEPVEVRRNAAVSAVLGAAASAVAIAYLWRAGAGGAPLDWLLCLVMTGFAVVFLHSLFDSRTPLLVADEMGVRLRLGSQWRGLPWEAIDRVVIHPRKGFLRDGRVLISLVHVTRTIEGLEGRARRHAVLNRKLYGAALAVPLGLGTRLEGSDQAELPDRMAALAQDRAEVLTVTDTPETPVIPVEEPAAPEVVETVPEAPRERGGWLRRRRTPGPDGEAPIEDEPGEPHGDLADLADLDAEFGEPVALSETDLFERVTARDEPAPLRHARTQDAMRTVIEAVTPVEHTDSRVRAIAKLGDPVGPLVIDNYQPEPAYDPVIGPELAASRTRVGLSVDELAERTRIRPHVIESIEVDDFTPCGGDFYARGHIRTLARVLGKDPVPMLEVFDARYAKAPINARKVFEAELATGMGGQMRRPYGGASWTGLVATVLVLVLVWAMVRLFAGDDAPLMEEPPPVLNGSAGLANGNSFDRPVAPAGPRPVRTTLTAVNAGAHVEVRDGDGNLVYEGDLVIGEVKTVRAAPPVTVSSDNGSAVSVRVGRTDQGYLGESEESATQTYQAEKARGGQG